MGDTAATFLMSRLLLASVEFLILGFFVGAMLALFPSITPTWRRRIWLLVLCKPAITVLTGALPGFIPVPEAVSGRFIGDLIYPESHADSLITDGGWAAFLLKAWLFTWITIAAALLIRVWCQAIKYGQFIEDSLEKGYLLKPSSLKRLDPELSIPPQAKVIVTPEDEGPLVLGIQHPAVIIPETMLPWVNQHRDPRPEECRRLCQVLRHELVHIENRDYVLSLFANLMLSLFWFHPIAHWAYRRLRLNNELCCDLGVIGNGVDASEYIDTLMNVVAGRFSNPGFALGMLGDHAPATVLHCRVNTVLSGWRKFHGKRQTWAYVTLVIMVLAMPRFLTGPVERQIQQHFPQMYEVLFADMHVEVVSGEELDRIRGGGNVAGIYARGTLELQSVNGRMIAVANRTGEVLPGVSRPVGLIGEVAEVPESLLTEDEVPDLGETTLDGDMLADLADTIEPQEPVKTEEPKRRSRRADWMNSGPSVLLPDSPFLPPTAERKR